MMFAAGAGAAALSSKTATAPAALAAYDGSGVAWDCAVPDSQVAASNGASSGTIESAGFSVKGNGKTLDSGKETTFNSEDVTFEINGNSDETSPYAWSIKNSLVDGYLDCGPLQLVDASSSVMMGCLLDQAMTVGN